MGPVGDNLIVRTQQIIIVQTGFKYLTGINSYTTNTPDHSTAAILNCR